MDIPQKLGYPKDTRLLMIHADDAGLSQTENQATIAALKKGMVNSYSIMVPCPAFDEIAEFALGNPQYDYGIHLTLTCEWKTYKFGPILPKSEVPSIVDEEGNFFGKRPLLKEKATLSDVKKELTAQIEKALTRGLTPSHLDVHMFSLGISKEFFQIYRELSQEFQLPILLSKSLFPIFGMTGADFITDEDININSVFLGDYSDFENGHLKDYYKRSLQNLTPGMNLMLIHTAYNDSEMQRITADHPNFGAEWRQIDFDFFTGAECRQLLDDNDIQLINWRTIKNMLF